MAVDYVSLAEFKDDINETSANRDAFFSRKITIASRVVDRLCGFSTAEDGAFAAQTMTRYYDVAWDDYNALADYERFLTLGADHGPASRLELDMPLLSVTSLKTDEDGDGAFEVTWATTDYHLYPLNGPPFDSVHVNFEQGNYHFPAGQKRIELAGSWGDQTAVPPPIREATLLLAQRYSKRPNTPYGLEKTAERAIALKSDPDVVDILVKGGYIKRAVFA